MEIGVKKDYFSKSKICFFSSFPPKECGIATFTKDLTSFMNKKWNPKLKSKVIAIHDDEDFYNYSENVINQIKKENLLDYINTAKRINNEEDIRLVCIQHEFGLFGGEYGSYLIAFLETIKKPVVIVFHSVLPEPNDERKKIVREIISRVSAVIVMAKTAVEILNKDYNIEKNKIHVVYHGIPNVDFCPNYNFKKKLKLNDNIVLSTFGLLSVGKGIEYVIRALPPLIEKYPNLLYIILGETHPAIRKREGEKYRNKLVSEVEKLGLKNNVKFYNKYLTLQEIISFILASDIYICTNLEKNQIVSGTLSYALGCGRAVISTPITYAEEILGDERGILTEFKNPESYAEAIDKILSDSKLKNKLEKNAYAYSRPMIWSNVASSYLNIFNKIVQLREETTKKYPSIKLDHLRKLTDDFGCIQFAENSAPDINSGYTLDDNARALITAIMHHNLFNSKQSSRLIKTYLNFLEHAQEENGIFKNNHSNKGEMINPYSEDAFGRAIWALGYTVNKSNNPQIKEKAKKLFNNAYEIIETINSPRTKAFSIIGLYHYHKEHQNPENLLKIKKLADSLIDLYEKQHSEDWPWFEEYLTYSNSKLPESLLLAYEILKDEKYLEIAEKTLNFLSDTIFINSELSPIGQNGWYNKHGQRAFFDQQPVDVSCVVQTYLVAYKITGNKEYYNKAVLAFNWFLGKNHLKQIVYNESTGGCCDGISKENMNLNQGAESTISYLLARLRLEEIKREEKIYYQ